MPRICLNDADSFCYICGEITFVKRRTTISNLLEIAYESYFGCKIGDQDKWWAPHFACLRCFSYLTQWWKNGSQHLQFGVPMVWREPSNHSTDCYFCQFSVKKYNRNSLKSIKYPDLPSARRPIPHIQGEPKPISPQLSGLETAAECGPDPIDETDSSDPDFEVPSTSQRISKEQLHSLSCDLVLSKKKSELLASRLNKQGALDQSAKVSSFRKRGTPFEKFFTEADGLVYCSNVPDLMKTLNISETAGSWRLFIDSSRASLKAVLLHKGNILPSIPIGYSRDLGETYENLQLLLQHVSYPSHQWKICADFKVIGIILGLQSGNTKHPCFLCEWDSRARTSHYIKKKWPTRSKLIPGQKNIKHKALVSPRDIILPPLHIKLGLAKNFIKGLSKTGRARQHLSLCFPQLSTAKIDEGVLTGPQIKKLIDDPSFTALLDEKEKQAWSSFITLVRNFLGNHKSPSYINDVKHLLEAYKGMGCNMSLKIHYLHSHLDFFPENLGDESDEHGERFHQEFSPYENRFNRNQLKSLLGDYCWSIAQKVPSLVELK